MASQRYVAKIHMSSPSAKAPAAGAGPRPGTRGETASTTIKELMDKGTDRPFRELLYRLLRLGNVMAANQEDFARYIGAQSAQLLSMAAVPRGPGCAACRRNWRSRANSSRAKWASLSARA